MFAKEACRFTFDFDGLLGCVAMFSIPGLMLSKVGSTRYSASGDFDICLVGVLGFEAKMVEDACDFGGFSGCITSWLSLSLRGLFGCELKASRDKITFVGLLEILLSSLLEVGVETVGSLTAWNFDTSLCKVFGAAGKTFGGTSGFDALEGCISLSSELLLAALILARFEGVGSLAAWKFGFSFEKIFDGE